MFRNYLAAALRNLARNKLVSCINIAGLALGFAAALLIGLYLRYELSFDDSLPGERQVYRVSLTFERAGMAAEVWDTADPSMAEFLRLDYPEVAMSARIGAIWPSVRRGGRRIPGAGVLRRSGFLPDAAVSNGRGGSCDRARRTRRPGDHAHDCAQDISVTRIHSVSRCNCDLQHGH